MERVTRQLPLGFGRFSGHLDGLMERQGFFHHEPELRARKRGFLRRPLGQANLVYMQESHGSDSAIRDWLGHEAKHFSFFPSSCRDSDSGGVITVIRSSLLLGSCVLSSPLVPGKIVKGYVLGLFWNYIIKGFKTAPTSH